MRELKALSSNNTQEHEIFSLLLNSCLLCFLFYLEIFENIFQNCNSVGSNVARKLDMNSEYIMFFNVICKHGLWWCLCHRTWKYWCAWKY